MSDAMKFFQSKILRQIGGLSFFIGLGALSTVPVVCVRPMDTEEVVGEISGGYTVVSKFPLSGYAQDVLVVDSCAFFAQGEGGIAIVNIKDPEHPELLSEVLHDIPGYSQRVAYVKDSYGTEILYSANGTPGIATLDVTDKRNTKVLRRNNLYKPTVGFFVCDKILLSMTSADGIWFSDIRDPKNVAPSVQVQVPGYAKSVCMSADSTFALVAIGEGGFVQYDFSLFRKGSHVYDPNSTDSAKVLYSYSGRLDLPGSSEFIVNIPATQYACIACGTEGLQIVDYSDTNNVRVAGSFATGGFARTVRVAGDRAFLAAGAAGVQIIDISSITSPRRIGKIELTDVHGIYVHDGYIFAADKHEGLVIIKFP